MALTYESYIEKEKADHEKRIDSIKRNKNMLSIATEYGLSFGELMYFSDKRYADIFFTPTITMQLNLHPKKEDTIKVAYPVIDEMIRDPRLEMIYPLQKQPYADQEYVYATFQEQMPKGKSGVCLNVFIYIDRINTCKKVGTGKFREIMKVVCSDEAS